MENQIQMFNFSNNEIRTILTPSNEVLFVASDVCKVLDLSNVAQAVSRLDEDERVSFKMMTLGGEQLMIVISESGLYSLVLSSRKPEAKVFKKWVTSEVLPAIRKTGKFEVATTSLSPLQLFEVMLNQAKEQEAKLLEQSKKLTVIEDKVNELQAQGNHSVEHFTIIGWYKLNKWKYNLTNTEIQQMGKALTSVSKALNYTKIDVPHTNHGTIGSYHKDLLKLYFDGLQGKLVA